MAYAIFNKNNPNQGGTLVHLKPTGTDIKLFYRFVGANAKGSIFEESFVEASPTIGTVPFNDTGFDEVEYDINVGDEDGTTSKTTFGAIQFKIVLLSSNTSVVPKVKDFRAICST